MRHQIAAVSVLVVLSLATATIPATVADTEPRQLDAQTSQVWPKLADELAAVDAKDPGVHAAQRALDASATNATLAEVGVDSTARGAHALLEARPSTVLDAPTSLEAPSGPPSLAVTQLLDRHEGDLDPSQRAQVEHLDELSPQLHRPLANLVEAFLAFEDAADAYLEAREKPTTSTTPAQVHEKLDAVQTREDGASTEEAVELANLDGLEAPALPLDELDALLDARQSILEASLSLDEAVTTNGPADLQVDLCPTVAIDLSRDATTYEEDCRLIVDAGGSDTYHNNAGGTNMVDREAPCGSVDIPQDNNATALVDLAGNDAYGDPADPVDCGANGGGWAGAGLLVDARGDDTYTGGEGAINGGGYDGVGSLIDLAGDDHHVGEQSTNAASFIGAGALYDVTGDDTYRSERIVANGAGLLAAAALVDGSGDDTYEANESTVNGAGGLGSGVLVDGKGNDTYVGEGRANGGANLGTGMLVDGAGDDEYRAGASPSNGKAELGAALLLDGAGEDRYREFPDRDLQDQTILPKGSYGAQIDAPHTPSDVDHPVQDTPASAEARPNVIVGVGDDGINPYHEDLYRPELTEHPCTYIQGFPCDVEELDLTLPADPATDVSTVDEAHAMDSDEWNRTRPGEVFWIPQTPFVAVTCQGTQSAGCAFGTDHGPKTTSSVLAENPDALIGFVASDGDIEPLEAYDIPVDLYSVSFGNVAPLPFPGGPCPLADDAPLYVTSAGNSPYTTLASCWKGNPKVITVGGAYAADDTEEAEATKQPEVVSYYCRPVAVPDQTSGTMVDCGTSFGTPTVAGALSEVVLELRRDANYLGSVPTGTVAPGTSVADLRDALNRTASYNPEPQYPQTSAESDFGNNSGVPLNPAAPWLQWGWGFYDGLVAEDTITHLRDNGQTHEPKPIGARAYMTGQHAVKGALYSER